MLEESKKRDNLGGQRSRGLTSLKAKVNEKEIVCTVTDKSGRWACDALDNYRNACSKELLDEEKTPKITLEDHNNGEREMNCQALALMRMMGLEDGKKGDRLRNTMVAEGVKLAPFYGLRKDHKSVEVGHEQEGPKIRPVCGAIDCLTKRTSYILCLFLSRLIPGNKTHCSSTDELLDPGS